MKTQTRLAILALIGLSVAVNAQTSYTTDANTLFLYHLNEAASATNAIDSSGHGRNAKYGTAVTTGLPAQTGMGNSAKTASGVNGRIIYSDPTTPGQDSFLNSLATQSFTLEAWVMPSADFFNVTSGNQMVMAIQPNGTITNFDLRFSILPSGGKYYLSLGSSTGPNNVYTVGTPLNWTVDTWYHIAVTATLNTNGTWTYRFYNNVAGGSTTPTAFYTVNGSALTMNSSTNSRDLIIGASYDGNYFRGQIDEARVSDIARTQFDTLAIPEPSTLLFLIMGLALPLFLRRRR